MTLKQKTPLARKTPMKRGTSALQAKPAKEPKRRQRKCAVKSCRTPFEPRSITHKACSVACAETLVLQDKVAKVRKERQEGLAKLKTRSDYIKECQRAFNAFIRERDKDLPCICCGKVPQTSHHTGGSWDAGHYRSVGSAPHLRFVEDNCHRQTKRCNRDGAGRAVDYRAGLIARIGLARVEALEADDRPRHYDTEDLKAIRDTYRAKLAALKKGDI